MSYRDDLESAHQRIAQLEGELRDAKAEPITRAVPGRSPALVILLLVGGLVLMGGVAVAVVLSRPPAAREVVPVDAVVRHPQGYEGRNLRVQGELVVGTITTSGDPCQLRFALERDHLRLPVRLKACAPDTFRDVPNMLVHVDGRLQADGTFEGTNMVVNPQIDLPGVR